jgi:hypothetical protein
LRTSLAGCLKKAYQASNSDNERVLTTPAAVAQPRRAVWTASSMLRSPCTEMGIRRHHDRSPGLDRQADVFVSEVETIGEAVDLERCSGLDRDLDRALEVERIFRAVADQAAGGMAERRHVRVRIASITCCVTSSLGRRWPA